MEELNSGPPKTNPSSGREEDLNPGPPDYKSSALTTRPRCLLTLFNLLSTPDKRHLYHDMVQERMHRIIKLCTFADLRRPINLTDLFRFTTHDLLFLSLFSFIFKH